MSFRNPFGADEEQGVMDEACESLSLSRTQRFYGFGICFGIGFILSFMGTILLFFGNVKTFAAVYTLGNIVSLMGTGFLIGPVKQCKTMFDPIRRWATVIFVCSMAATLIFALAIPDGKGAIGAIVFLVVQFCAFIWYSASYIPYGRTLLTKFASSICG